MPASRPPVPAAGESASEGLVPTAEVIVAVDLVTALPGAYLLLTPSLHIAAVSEAYLAVSLTTRPQLLGRYLFEVFPGQPDTPEGDTMTNLRASLAQVLATGQPHRMAVQAYSLPDPATPGALLERHWQPLNTPVLDAQGAVSGLLHSVEDVTARVRATTQLQVSQAQTAVAQAETEVQRQRLHEVLMRLPAQVATYRGPDFVYDFVNPRYQAPFPGRTFLGRPLREVLPEVAVQGLLAAFDQVYQSGEPFASPEQELHLDLQGTGQPEAFYYNFFLLPLRDAAGRVDGLLDFSYEVTEQVRARQQVQQLNQELARSNQVLEARVLARTREVQRLFEQAPQAIVVLRGPTFVIEQANEHAAAIWGRSVAEVLGRPHFEALSEAAGQGYEELLTGVMTSGEPLVLHEVPVVLARAHLGRPDKGYYSILFKPLRDEHQRVNGVAVMWTEMTEQVLARQQVQQLNQELATSNAALHATNEALHHTNSNLSRTNADLDNFIYTASHDLKTPIANIEGLLRLLGELLPEPLRENELVRPILLRMQDSIERFRRTIGHLTDVSKLQAEFAQPAEAVALATVIEEVRQDLWPQFMEVGAQLAVAVDDCQPRVFSPKNLRSIIYNLLSNALKYRHPDRPAQVRIACGSTGDSLALTVQDNGLGMSAQQQTRLFQLFQRLHTHVEGTGVGLYAVKKIVENAGGTITVQSQEEVGTTFTLTFPT